MATEARLEVLEGVLQGQTLLINESETTIGRGEDNVLGLAGYTQVSRRHARLFHDGTSWHIEDLTSTNGTFVDDQRVSSAQLRDGTILQLGDFKALVSIPLSPNDVTQVLSQPSTTPTVASGVSIDKPPPPSPSYTTPPARQPLPAPQPPPYAAPPSHAPASGNVSVNAPINTSTQLSGWGLICGTVALCILLLGLMPCLGWLNWFTLMWAAAGNILSVVGLITEQTQPARSKATIGLVCGLIAGIVGSIRLAMGGGIC